MTFTALARDYVAAWNETDPAARDSRVGQLFAPTARYVDPLVEAHGHQQIGATIGAVQAQFSGLVFSLLGDVDAHGDQARFTWGLGPEGAEPVAIGFDVVVRDAEGRLELVLGFLDRVPA